MPFQAVPTGTSLRFYNLPLTHQHLSLLHSNFNLFLQEPYCLALGEEELAEIRLFCVQWRRAALGQGWLA